MKASPIGFAQACRLCAHDLPQDQARECAKHQADHHALPQIYPKPPAHTSLPLSLKN